MRGIARAIAAVGNGSQEKELTNVRGRVVGDQGRQYYDVLGHCLGDG
jgi:hypothetical protein